MTIMKIKLIDLFDNSGLTATDLCNRAQISHTTWNNLKKNGGPISRPLLVRILRTLNQACGTSYTIDEIVLLDEDGK